MYYRRNVQQTQQKHHEAPKPRPALQAQHAPAAQRLSQNAPHAVQGPQQTPAHGTKLQGFLQRNADERRPLLRNIEEHATQEPQENAATETHDEASRPNESRYDASRPVEAPATGASPAAAGDAKRSVVSGIASWMRPSDAPASSARSARPEGLDRSPFASATTRAEAATTKKVGAANDADRSIPQPPFFEYRARKANPNGPSKFANDVRSHLDPKHGNAYEDSDPSTAVHETTHGINSDVRNAKNLPGEGRVNGFYVGNDKAIRLTEPNLDLRKAKEFLPPSLQSARSRMYVDQQKQWNDRPLYLLDELTAYTNGGAAATELAQGGNWNLGGRDAVAGQLHFTPINMAMAMAIDKHDPSYFQNHPETKDYYGWAAMRAMDGFRAGKDIPQFKGFGQEEYLRNLQSSPDAQPMRDFIKKTWGQEFHDRLLFGPQAVDTSKPAPGTDNAKVDVPKPVPGTDNAKVDVPKPVPGTDNAKVDVPKPVPSTDNAKIDTPAPAPKPAPAPAPVNVGGRPGQQAPEINAKGWLNADGTPSLGNRQGEVSVVEFWGTFCPPCRAQIPHLNEMQAKYKDQGLQIMALTSEDKGTVGGFAQRNGMQYPIGYGSKSNRDFGVSGIPHSVVVGRDGKVVWSGHPGQPEFERAIQTALEQPRPAPANDGGTVAPKPAPPIDGGKPAPAPVPPVDSNKVAPKPAPIDPIKGLQTQKLADGTYVRDGQGRLTQTLSIDGSMRRDFRYEDASDPNRVTSLTLNGTQEFRRDGANRWTASEVAPDGSRRTLGDWHGEISVKDGLLHLQGADETSPRIRGAEARDLSADEVARRQGGTVAPPPSPSPSNDTAALARTVRTDEGTYTRDEQGRIIEMRGNDGSSSRTFVYGDPSNPNRVTQETLADGTTYKYIGPVKVNGRQMTDQGMEANSWSVYDANGTLKGNWYGVRAVSPNGVYSNRDIDRQSSLTHSFADGKTISEAQRQSRNADGIWPNKVDITRKDGRRIEGRLEGNRLQGLTETFPKTDKTDARQVAWNRDANGQWQSNEQPPRVRKSMDVLPDGSLRYEDDKGQRTVERADGSREVTADGVTRAYGVDETLTKVTLADGRSRSFGYKDGKLQTITDVDRSGRQTWTRQGDTHDFTTPGVDHKRQIPGTPDASGEYDYVSCNGDSCEQKTSKVGDPLERDAKGLDIPGIDGKPLIDGLVPPAIDNKVSPQPPVDANLPTEALQAQQAFADAARQAGLDPKRMEGYLADFQANAKKYNYSAEQITQTFNHLNTLLTSPEKSTLYTDEQRKNLVETAMHNIARPTEIDQGYHPTCNVTTLEIYSATRHPEEYARLVKEVGLTGTWKTANGDTIKPPANALKPGDDETSYDLDKPSSGVRNLASQVMEMTLINGVYQTGGKGDKWKDRSYVMDKVSWQKQGGYSVKVGEDRIADRNGRPLSNKDSGPDFSQDDIVTASKMMLGKDNPMPYLGAPYSTNGGRTWNYDLPTSQRLMDLKADGKFPLGVSTIGGAHVQTIHDVKVGKDGKTYVKLDNQHGAKKDGWVTIGDLHRTMRQGIELTPSIPFEKIPD